MPDITKVTLSSKGQLAIPRRMREAMGVSTGSQMTLVLHADGRLEIAPVRHTVTSLFGLLMRPGETPLSISDMDAAIDQELAKENPT